MKKLFILFFLFFFAFLFFAPFKTYAMNCPTIDQVTDHGVCPVCPPGWVYNSSVQGIGGSGGCLPVDPTVIQSLPPSEQGGIATNCVSTSLDCSALGAGYTCSTTTQHVPSSSSNFGNGCCNGTTCAIDNSGNPPPIVPPSAGGHCDLGPTCGNANTRSTCDARYLCQVDATIIGGACDNTGICTPNTNGSCATDSDCATGYACNASGTCATPPNLPPPPPLPVYGGAFGGGTTTLSCGTGINDVWTLACVFPLLANLIFWFLTFSGVVALFFIIFSGIRLITSGGDPKTVASGRNIITFAIAGLALILLSFFILNLIGHVTRLACIAPSHPLSFTSCGGTAGFGGGAGGGGGGAGGGF